MSDRPSAGPAGSVRVAPDRLAGEARQGIASRLARDGWPDFVFAFHDRDEIGPRMLARIARHTGLSPEDLRKS